MPLLDNYLLRNKGLDGPISDVYQTITPALGYLETTVSAGSTPELRTLATFPAGTTLITGMSNEGSSTTLAPYVGGTISSISYGFVLIDKSGAMLVLGQVSAAYVQPVSLMIDLKNRKVNTLWVYSNNGASAVNDNSTKYNHVLTISSSFDVEGELRLVYKILSNTYASSSIAYTRLLNFTIISK